MDTMMRGTHGNEYVAGTYDERQATRSATESMLSIPT
jgi:hypothetical protein